VLEPRTWSGEDIFIPRDVFVYMVTERFKRFCEENEIANAVFIPAEEYWEDSRPWENMEKAREMLTRVPDANLLEKRGPNREILRYEPKTNYMVIADYDGRIREILRPIDGIEFWNRQ